MRKRIFASIVLVALLSMLLLSAGVVAVVYNRDTTQGQANLQSDIQYMSAGYETGGLGYLQDVRGYQGRITLIAQDGEVLSDNRSDAAAMDNHQDRPEVVQARETGTGQSQRQSDTLGERTLYYAMLLEDGNVLRLSVELNSIVSNSLALLPWLLPVVLVVLVVSAFLAKRLTQGILKPLQEMDLDSPLENGVYEEISPIVRRISSQKEQLLRKAEELAKQQEEFGSVIQNMDEGLILIDHEGTVQTVNQSACGILNIPQDARNKPLVSLNRDLALQKAAREAGEGKRTVQELLVQGRRYRLVASPVRSIGEETGAVLLLMDDTERLEAEQTRREFSANVSHELKTPLTSISGYAEIIRNGLVQPGDVCEFAGKIYDEAARLIALVEDILQLSRLDEKEWPQEEEPIELLALAKEVVNTLQEKASKKGVELEVIGDPVTMQGIGSVLHEVMYNLTDNAIRYNHESGFVRIYVEKDNNEAVLRVEDSGIGIDATHQVRVFERFYRVDKSHSRQSGGTGLGLAIVKRGVLFHNGQVSLESTFGKGSAFTIRLPLEDAGM